MKQLLLMFFCTVLFSAVNISETHAQEKEEYHYIYTDLSKNVTYGVFLRISGYQVEVFYNSTGAPKWQTATVTYTSDEIIKYKIAYNNWEYEMTLDSNNEDACYIRNISTNGKKLRYFIKQ